MKLALSNIALPAFDHSSLFPAVAALGYQGIEVAPSRVWRDTVTGPTHVEIETYRRAVEGAGLEVVGLHSLLFGLPDLGIFINAATRARTLDYLVHLSKMCRDLGGRTMIFGGGRRRGAVPAEEAWVIGRDFAAELCHRIAPHGTIFCFEPLGPKDSDFINTVAEAVAMAEAVDSPAMRVQLDAKALAQNDEMNAQTISLAVPYLVHAHANELDLGALAEGQGVEHATFGRLLRKAGYDGYVTAEQRMLDENTPLVAAAQSAEILRQAYAIPSA